MHWLGATANLPYTPTMQSFKLYFKKLTFQPFFSSSWTDWKICPTALGIIPTVLSSGLSGPSMVKVLPLPVWPYAKTHTLYPSRALWRKQNVKTKPSLLRANTHTKEIYTCLYPQVLFMYSFFLKSLMFPVPGLFAMYLKAHGTKAISPW